MVIDNLLAVTLVLVNGNIVEVSEKTDPDLFWVIQGGGTMASTSE
jgi:hypothetical protein